MEHEKLKKVIGDNIAFYRKRNNLTQLQLAEKINYSDKAVSKWERGEGLPDIYVLNDLAELFKIEINDFLREPKARSRRIFLRNKIVISIAYTCIIWLVAVLAYVCVNFLALSFNKEYLIFSFALSLSFVLLLIFTCVWKNKFLIFIMYSGLIWTFLLNVFLILSIKNKGVIFIIGIPLQLMGMMWLIFKKNKKEAKEETV